MEVTRYVTAAVILFSAGSATAQQVPGLSKDLHEISNLKTFKAANRLTAADIAMLRKNWFFVAPSEDYYVYSIYGQNDYSYIPSLITADNAVQLLHVCFDSTLEQIETTKLAPGAKKMSAAMLAIALKDWKAMSNTPMAGVAAKNAAYFGVADRLGGGKEPIPAAIMSMVMKTLAIVKSHQGFTTSPIFPYMVDFSQFIPRGHYMRSEQLRNYFLTTMWYGLMPLSAPHKPGESLDPMRQALLMSHELTHSDQLARWTRMDDVTSMLMGLSNHLTPLEAEVCAKRVFGPSPKTADWADADKVKAFIAELAKARPPAYVEDIEFSNAPDPGAIQVRFMGQRGMPDSYILQTLSGLERKKPSPLDVMAALGSESALRILEASPQKYNSKDWSEYVPRRTKLIKEFYEKPRSQWVADCYWAWLSCIGAVVLPIDTASQPFLATQAWADKSLYTALGSWAEMRHDTILYAQQSVVAEAGEDGDRAPNLSKGFVEPNLVLYSRERKLLKTMETELDRRSYLSSDLRKQLDHLRGILEFFIQCSESEIAGLPLSKAQYQRVRDIEAELEDLTQNMVTSGVGGYENRTPDDNDPALVADFHTANDVALEAAVGRADHVYAVVKLEGKLYLMRGASLSYYEFERPSSDRMTDHTWKGQLNENKFPPRPDWIHTFFVNKALNEKQWGP